jgi:hypothetical protein
MLLDYPSFNTSRLHATSHVSTFWAIDQPQMLSEISQHLRRSKHSISLTYFEGRLTFIGCSSGRTFLRRSLQTTRLHVCLRSCLSFYIIND